jgi:glycosyltransferase involved in cell wall biosynthesis
MKERGESLVSIVVPCFNAERTIEETIDSALSQSWSKVQVVVVDDGSVDNSVDVIKKFGTAILSYHGPNRGASAARNLGTSLSRGAYIQYLDADDILTPDALERRIEAIELSGADVVYSDWQKFKSGEDGSHQLGQVVARDMEQINRDPQIACATSFWAPPVALLYRRQIVDAIGGWREDLSTIQDARFLFDSARLGASFVRVNGVTAYYRESVGSLSRRDPHQFAVEVFKNAREIRALWESEGLLDHEREVALAGIFDSAARKLFLLNCTELGEAVHQFRSLARRRFGYPEVAYSLRCLLGYKPAYFLVAILSGVAKGTRSFLAASNR